jgi:hypothetical protein
LTSRFSNVGSVVLLVNVQANLLGAIVLAISALAGRPLQRQFHDGNRRVLRIDRDMKAKLTAHLQHRRILLQNLAANEPQSLGSRIFDHQFHQQPAETPSLQIGADEDRVFPAFICGVGVERTTPSMPQLASSMAMKAIARA